VVVVLAEGILSDEATDSEMRGQAIRNEISDKKILLEGHPVPNRCVIKEIHEAQDAYFDIGDAGFEACGFGGRMSDIRGVPPLLLRLVSSSASAGR